MMRKNLIIAFLSIIAMGCSKESEPSELESIQLDKNNLTLQIGATYQFKVTNQSEETQQSDYIWSTNNPNILSITDDGAVKALSVGEAKVIVKTSDSKYTDTCSVVVSPKYVESFTLSYPSAELEVNQTMTLSATYTPSDATYKQLKFESSDTTVAIVKDSIVTAKVAGNITIKATTIDGSNISRSFQLVVKEVPLTVNATSISLVSTNTFSLVVSPNADGCTYESENSYIASVSSAGLITAKRVGNTIVHIKNANKNLDATCEVTVTPQYNLFREPYLVFGATPATIKAYEKRVLASETTTGLIYTGENSYLAYLIYVFENSAYTTSGCFVPTAYSSLLGSFIGERYVYLGTSDGFILYLSTDSKTIAALKLYSTTYWIAMFYKNTTDAKLSSSQSYSILLKKIAPIAKSMKVQMPVFR
ncbi:MAG: Ig-like domain-containing protein [Bacteroidales bacterium]|nr:Ig-like domain-containing protein [Bacteroidales bacterium]